jgi:hypothetical protein
MIAIRTTPAIQAVAAVGRTAPALAVASKWVTPDPGESVGMAPALAELLAVVALVAGEPVPSGDVGATVLDGGEVCVRRAVEDVPAAGVVIAAVGAAALVLTGGAVDGAVLRLGVAVSDGVGVGVGLVVVDGQTTASLSTGGWGASASDWPATQVQPSWAPFAGW